MHNHLTPVAVVLLSIASLWTPAWGQTVYKCGNVYSQVPCPGAVAVEASDNRTPAQKAQADAAAAQAAKSADKMEKARLALEKAPVAKAPKLPVPASQIAKTQTEKETP